MEKGLGPIRPVQLTERVYDEVEAAIIRCELPPGEILTDRKLADRLEVSRTPVREALQRLGATGLVVPHGRGGWEVVGFDSTDLRELFELRRVLEPLGLDRLLKDGEEEAIRELASFFDDFPTQISEAMYSRYFSRDHAFHKRIVECSGNRRVIGFYEVAEKQIDRGRHFLSTGYRGRVDENFAEHLAICRAIGERDLPRAREALLHHLQKGEELMAQFIQELQQSTAPTDVPGKESP